MANWGLPPKPADTVFGLRVDGKLTQPGWPNIEVAERMAIGLVQQGRTVEIVDRVTMQTVKRL